MYVIENENNEFFVGIVYHGECGFHGGFTHDVNNEGVKVYTTRHEAEADKFMLAQLYREKDLEIIKVKYTLV
jgi:hypothetical protein